jgi:hypothetical protein
VRAHAGRIKGALTAIEAYIEAELEWKACDGALKEAGEKLKEGELEAKGADEGAAKEKAEKELAQLEGELRPELS